MATWKMAGLTDAGRVRGHNEDAIGWDAGQGWAVVADGMGGHQGGEVASAIAVEVIGAQLSAAGSAVLLQAVEQANSEIHAELLRQPQAQTMGTTVVAVTLQGELIQCAHVGDSRLYRLRGGELVQLTHDHSLVQELVDEGMLSEEQARGSGQRNIITRALGLGPEMEVALWQGELLPGDSYLLCSDGLSNMLDDGEIAALLLGESLPGVVRRLIDAANARGGDDNISVIVIQVWE